MKKLLLIPTILLAFGTVYAQQIKPYDLIQLYKYSQVNDSKFGQSVFTYLRTIDTGWKPTSTPIVTAKDVTVAFAYTKTGKSWYMPETYQIMITRTYGPPLQDGLVYGFKELDLWTSFIGQMAIMNATKLGTTSQNGGVRTIYTINGIAFILVDFPPGIQGPERTFQVSILTNNADH